MTLPPDGALVEVRWVSHRPRRSPLDLLPLTWQMWVRDHILWRSREVRRVGTLTTRPIYIPALRLTAVEIDGEVVTTIDPDWKDDAVTVTEIRKVGP